MPSDRETLEPLDSEIRALLDEVEPAGAPIDDGVRTSMRTRLNIALATRGTEPSPAPRGGASPGRRWLSHAAAAAAGAAAALVVQRALPPPVVAPPQQVAVVADAGAMGEDAAPTLEPVSPHSLPSVREAPSARPTAAPLPPSAAASTSASSSEHDADLAVETRLVDTARAALAHADFAAALAAASAHERRFPNGRLREEREAIAIQALAGLGRRADAATRAEAFRARYPQSFFLPLVNRAAP